MMENYSSRQQGVIIMVSSISGSSPLYPAQPANNVQQSAGQGKDQAATLPANPPSSRVSLSDEAKKLAAAKALTDAPVAVAAASDNAQVDKTAQAVYQGQQAQQQLETYAAASQANQPPESSNPDVSSPDAAKAVKLAAASENPQVDELALSLAAAQQAQQKLNIYREVAQNGQPQPPTSIV